MTPRRGSRACPHSEGLSRPRAQPAHAGPLCADMPQRGPGDQAGHGSRKCQVLRRGMSLMKCVPWETRPRAASRFAEVPAVMHWTFPEVQSSSEPLLAEHTVSRCQWWKRETIPPSPRSMLHVCSVPLGADYNIMQVSQYNKGREATCHPGV